MDLANRRRIYQRDTNIVNVYYSLNWSKCVANTPRKAFVCERLLQNSHGLSANAVLLDGIVRISLLIEGRPSEGPADSAADFREDVKRVGNQDSSDGRPQDDDQFGGLHQNLQIAVFHQIPGDDGAKYHHNSYD